LCPAYIDRRDIDDFIRDPVRIAEIVDSRAARVDTTKVVDDFRRGTRA
jgi:hypothetical protein